MGIRANARNTLRNTIASFDVAADHKIIKRLSSCFRRYLQFGDLIGKGPRRSSGAFDLLKHLPKSRLTFVRVWLVEMCDPGAI